jgi:cell wall-associated NlpC family hydrolase
MLALVMSFSIVTPAFADPIADKRAQADAVQAQITALDSKVEVTIEQYNKASGEYDKLTTKVHRTEAKLRRIAAKTSTLQSHLYTRADDMYRTGPLGFLEVLLNAKSFEEFTANWDLLTAMSARDAQNVKELKVSRADAKATRATLKEAQAEVKAKMKTLTAKKASIKAQLAKRKETLAGIRADIAILIAQQQAADAAAVRAAMMDAAKAAVWIGPGGSPPQGSKESRAVWWALSRIGAPYVWAASGPNEFDCSGLTMWAYAQVGVPLPHYSGAQISCGTQVSRDALQPGDLVFFGSPIHHVGMYIGHGLFVHAPHSGDVVRVSSLDSHGGYAGACRP